MARRRAGGQAGFIITLEFLLIMTILGIGVLVGIAAVRNALFKRALNQKAQTVWVFDSNNVPLGPMRDMDEHEAPRLFYIDRDVPWNDPPVEQNFRAVVGVRDDRFTTRHRIFYTNSTDCGVTPLDANEDVIACIVTASNEVGDNRAIGIVSLDGTDTGGDSFVGAGRIANAGGIGYLYSLQSDVPGPSYGIGRDVSSGTGLPGDLFRQCNDSDPDNQVCDCDPMTVRSVWTSQTVTDGLPCEPLPAGVTVEAAKCPDGRAGANIGDQCLNPADPRCVTVGGGGGSGNCSTDGSSCTLDSQCRRCSGNLAQSCTVDAECGGTCSISGVPCTTGADCLGGTPGTCSGDDQPCDTAADCDAQQYCSISGDPCDGQNDCAPTSQNGQCEPQTCSGATLDLCVGATGPCTGTCVIGGGGLTCACPPGWVDYGANCCPPGTTQTAPGQCTIGNTGEVVEAVPVELFNDFPWAPPFKVNLPPDPNALEFLAPTKEGQPGTSTGIPYDVQNYQFNRAPEGELPNDPN